MWTHSIRKANVTVGMVRAAAVDLVWVAGLFYHHRAGLHRFWSAEQQHKQRIHTLLHIIEQGSRAGTVGGYGCTLRLWL